MEMRIFDLFFSINVFKKYSTLSKENTEPVFVKAKQTIRKNIESKESRRRLLNSNLKKDGTIFIVWEGDLWVRLYCIEMLQKRIF